MNAPKEPARRGGDPRHGNLAPGPHSSRASYGERRRRDTALNRGGLEARRDRTPSPARREPRTEPLSADLPNPAPRIDPRWYQIVMLSALLAYGVFGLRFGVGMTHVALVIGAALLT